MATLTLTYDTGNVSLTRIQDGLSGAYGWTATIPDPANPAQTIPNPETKAQFARRVVGNFIRTTVRNQEAAVAKAAAEAAIADVTLT
jgi:hypothetical protein